VDGKVSTLGLDPFVFIPFSAGSRNCIGQHLSQLEAKIILSEFITRFQFNVVANYEHKMAMKTMYTPLNPLLFDIKSVLA